MRPAARYACDPAASRGRLHREPGTGKRGPRDAFQRDRDRIIHSVPFRRLRHKTQVFVAPDGDHFRVRLTHSLEVAQIASGIVSQFEKNFPRHAAIPHLPNANQIQAIGLTHDLGHSPFGHGGEVALNY